MNEGKRNQGMRIRVGVGGWTYEPWRNNFYPAGLPHARELGHASRELSAIEINGTYYSTFKPASFAKWRDETPEDFVFSLKANRFATNRKLLGTAGESIERFLGSGIVELREKLGPILWQFMPTKKFEPEDFEAFLALLPAQVEGRKLRHVLDVRHESFLAPGFLPLAQRYGCTVVHTDSPDFPAIEDTRSSMAYIRLMRSEAHVHTGYARSELAKWAQGAQAWTGKGADREAFIFLINGAKERAPHGAKALLQMLREDGAIDAPDARPKS